MALMTQFAGNFNAVEYAYGSAFPAALSVGIGNTSTGSQTINVTFGYTTLNSGKTFLPLNTNAPINVGTGTNLEKVTPSAVSQPTPGVYDSATITANFSNLHGTGDPIASATYGLQEALNAAGAYGGGQVIVDAAWKALGGTDLMISSATVPSGVVISDNRSGGASLVTNIATVNIANAAVLTLNATPVSLVAAPGAGSFIEVISIVAEHIFATGTFTNGSTLQCIYHGGSIACTGTIATGLLVGPVANEMATAIATALSPALSSNLLNLGVDLHATSTEYASGGGSLRVQIRYVVHSGL